jgi:antirestriction protein ArdC
MRDTHHVTPRRDLHAGITAKIIAAIEKDPGQPQMPWRRSGKPLWMPENALTANRYNGINVIALWAAAEMRGFTSPVWATYRQFSEIGAQVRRGAKAEMVVFYKDYDVEPTGEDDDGKRRVARASYVFNVADVEGYVPPDPPPRLGPIERIDAADRFVTATGARIEHGGESAYYRPSTDHIQMPDEGLFCGTATMDRRESYYAVLLHELTHWTAPQKRCNRDLSKRFLKAEVAGEELVAEIGSAFLCAELGITQDTRPDHAAYIHQWCSLLRNDPRAIFTAAAKASEAVAYLKRCQPAVTQPEDAP